ncbi:MAG: hypothetical protein HY921_05565 [Elusimicrobia bacterium]|nr:hypothetical protein [Elusimicrobiota bacterium]
MPKRRRPPPASKADLESTRGALAEQIGTVEFTLKGEMRAVQSGLKGEIQDVRFELTKVDNKVDRIAIELIKTREEMATKTDFTYIKTQLSQIIANLDGLAGETADNRRTLLVYDKIIGEHGRQLNAHETRISSLENRS